MNQVALILVIVFTVLIVLGLAAFLTIFFIQKSIAKNYKKLIENYNSLNTKINEINIYKLDVLAQNKMLNQQKFIQLKNNYQTLKDNCHTIYEDLTKMNDVVKSMNWKAANNMYKNVAYNIETTSDQINIFLNEYYNSTKYFNDIEGAMQISIDLFNDIKKFYYKNLVNWQSFKLVNDLINVIQDMIDKSQDLSKQYDFDQIVSFFRDLHKKIKVLWKSINTAIRLQFIDVYLLTAKENNEKLLTKSNVSLVYKDKEELQKANNLYEKDYSLFKKAYLEFDMANAHKYAISAAIKMAKISELCYEHASSLDLINQSLDVINEQTDKIVTNKQNILNSISTLSSYFAKDAKTLDYFKQIEDNVNNIANLSSSANSMKTATVNDKLTALKQLSSISSSIIACKDNIAVNVEKINYTLHNIITLLTELNSLYTYHIQMLPTIKLIGTDNPVRKEFIEIIQRNIDSIQQCVEQIVTSDNPNFKEISNKIVRMVDDTQQIKSKINSTVILKSYANRLMQYANRYRNEMTSILFEKAENEYNSKKYSNCIETLLSICKKFK